jgi:hypothetical protein
MAKRTDHIAAAVAHFNHSADIVVRERSVCLAIIGTIETIQ